MNKRQRKKKQKAAGTWGKPLKNKWGVEFTEAEKKALITATNRSNAMRNKDLANMNAEQTQLYTLGKESDFILTRQHADLQRFKTREEFEDYMTKQSRIHGGEYIKDRARAYKMNFINSLMDTYGDEAKDIAMKVRMIPPEKYIKMVAENEKLEIRYTPSDMKVVGRLNQLRTELGMKLKDEWFDETYSVTN